MTSAQTAPCQEAGDFAWAGEGVNRVNPYVYCEYITQLYGLAEYDLQDHPFLLALAQALSFTPFSTDKILYIKEELERGEQVARFEIDISDACNFRCPGCTFQFSRHDRMLAFELLEMIVAELKAHKIRAVTLVGGGDPTQYADGGMRLADVTELFNRNNLEVFLITNAFDLNNPSDLIRILSSVAALRISYYPFLAPGEPANKNEVVGENIRLMVTIREQLAVRPWILIGNLANYQNVKDYRLAVSLASDYGLPVTPRPYVAIRRQANQGLDRGTLEAILNKTLACYETIAEEIGPAAPIAAREFLERVLAFCLPIERCCAVTELGIVGKLRATGELFSCGQLSAVPREIRTQHGLSDERLATNITNSLTEAFDRHFRGRRGLTAYNSCPVCRESLNNVRLNNFANLPSALREAVLHPVREAYCGNRNLAHFW